MYDRRVKRLPVTDANGHLVGIISRADVLSVFDRTDHAIHQEITDEVLLGEFLADPPAFQVTVKDGIVTLAGCPETNETGHEIVRRVRHVQGVVAVRDRLDYPPAGACRRPVRRAGQLPDGLKGMTTMNATVKDVMTTEVVAVRRETTFKEMAAVLRQYRVSALPVVDDTGRVLGVVSEADLLAKEALADPGPGRRAGAPQGRPQGRGPDRGRPDDPARR